MQPFLLNPNHQDYIDGKTKLLPEAAWRVEFYYVMTLVLVILLAFSGFAIASLDKALGKRELAENGLMVDGIIIGKYTKQSPKSVVYRVEYRFEVDHQSYTDEDNVSHTFYNEAHSRQPIRVRYAPENPENSEIEGEVENWLNWLFIALFIFIVGLVVGGIGVVAIREMARHTRLYQRLEAQGKLVTGTIVSVTPANKATSIQQVALEYEFISPGSGNPLRDQVKQTFKAPLTPPVVGATVYILFADDECYAVL